MVLLEISRQIRLTSARRRGVAKARANNGITRNVATHQNQMRRENRLCKSVTRREARRHLLAYPTGVDLPPSDAP